MSRRHLNTLMQCATSAMDGQRVTKILFSLLENKDEQQMKLDTVLKNTRKGVNAVEMLQSYVSDTLDYFDTVTAFCNSNGKWRVQRETELEMMRDIQERASRGFLQVFQATDKGKAFGEYFTSGTRHEELEKELATVLKSTLEGVEKLTDFLDAVEKLAVTSLQVFRGGVVKLSGAISLESVEAIISAARLVCPLLLRFKRDAEIFFRPRLHNVAIFEAELKIYIDTTEMICKKMAQSSAFGFEDRRGIPQVWLAEYLPLDVVQNISSHVDQLSAIREDKDFRLVFLFQDKSVSGFVKQFNKCRPRMLKFLDDLEGCAVQLDSMKKATKISSVAGSSVGIAGGVMAIVGVALAPVTAGLSLGLTLGATGLGVTSGVNSLVTTVTEAAVNNSQVERANEALQSFMQDVERIQACLDEVTTQMAGKLGKDLWANAKAAWKVINNVRGIVSNVCTIHKAAKAPEIAKQAAKGTQAMTKMAAGIVLNVFFIGQNIYTIVKDSRSLARGEHSEASQFIRARAALLRSAVDGWSRIHDSVGTGMKHLKRGKDVLQRSF